MSLIDTLLRRNVSVTQAAPSSVQIVEAKAVTGFGAQALTYSTPLWTLQNTPQKQAWHAARMYAENPLVRLAETPVSARGGSVEWHLEDVNDDEVTDASAPNLVAIRDLLEKPQAALDPEDRQPGMGTRRGMWTQTLRHMGLCGSTFWYLDQVDALSGTPLAILYIAPWRLFEVLRPSGSLRGWSLDKSIEDGGTPLALSSVLPFYLNPPDRGYFASGLVETAGMKAQLDPIITRHVANVIGGGGRLTGLVSPKPNAGSVVTDDQWNQFVKDYRQIAQDPNAAQRLQIVQGPVDYVRTAATLDELSIVQIDERVQDSILGLWGVPRSQAGIAAPAGLNSGSTKGFDEAILWQGAIHQRLQSFYETVQYGLLDRYKAVGIEVELELEEPEFDDDTPLFQKAAQASTLPLTNDERRALVGLDPFKDQLAALGAEVWLPLNLVRVTDAGSEPPPEPLPAATPPAVMPPPDEQTTQPVPVKAALSRFEKLRRTVDTAMVPKVKSAVQGVLNDQKASVIRYLRTVGLEHLRRKKDFRWDPRRADEKLADALKPHLGHIVAKVTTKTHAMLAAKASLDDFQQAVLERVLTDGGSRITGINRTTRDAVAQAISDSIEGADTIDDVIAAVEALPIFDADRAELIARTESMFAYNDAALGSYRELGVTEVEAIDGDGDPECAERDGKTYSIEEAAAIEDHPNGTLDWIPVVPDEPPAKAETRVSIEYDEYGRIAGWTAA